MDTRQAQYMVAVNIAVYQHLMLRLGVRNMTFYPSGVVFGTS